MIHSHVRFLASLTLLFACGAAEFRVAAQKSAIVSKQPPVLRVFNAERNETTVTVLLIDPQSDEFRGMLVQSTDRLPPAIRLHSVQYSYAGTIPSPPQTIEFVFLPLDKYKTAPTFSVTADRVIVHEGEAILRELCCVQVNGHSENPQHIVGSLPVGILERLTQARKVELILNSKRGKYSFKLNEYKRNCLVALANTLK